MEPIKKNRLKFESVEPLSNPNSPVYETDEYPALREEKKFAPNLLLGFYLLSYSFYF
jgi:hypothetical protein